LHGNLDPEIDQDAGGGQQHPRSRSGNPVKPHRASPSSADTDVCHPSRGSVAGEMRSPLAAILLLAAFIPALRLLWLSRDNPHLGFYHDDGLYWVTAKSIAEGSGYRIASLPGKPHQTKYPPLFPLLLAAAWKLNPDFPANLGTPVWLVWLLLPALVWLSNRAMTQWGLEAGARLAVCCGLAANTYLAFFGTVLLAETWSTCFLLAALILVGGEKPGWLRPALGGLCGAAAYLAKTMVVPLLAAVPLALFWKGKRRDAVWFLACAVPPVLAWHAWASAHRAPASDSTWLYYSDYLGFWFRDVSLASLPALIYRNLDTLFRGGGGLLVFKIGDLPFGGHLARLVMIFALVGVVRWTRISRRLDYALFAAGLFALLLIWNYPPNERFLIPILPLLLIGVWTELSHLGHTIGSAWRRPEISQRVVAALIACIAGVSAAACGLRNLSGTWLALPALAGQSRAAAAEVRPVFEWISRNTPRDALFFADRDMILYLYTGRHATAIRIPTRHFYNRDQSRILSEYAGLAGFARARRLNYLLLTPADFELEPYPDKQRKAVREALARDPRVTTVFDSPAGTVVKVE
jgi:hypothetical protein